MGFSSVTLVPLLLLVASGTGLAQWNGEIVAWGTNYYGACDVPEPNEGFVAISTDACHCLGLKEDGSIVAWGVNNYGQCDVPEPNEGFVAVAGGLEHSLGLKEDGSIAWRGGGTVGFPIRQTLHGVTLPGLKHHDTSLATSLIGSHEAAARWALPALPWAKDPWWISSSSSYSSCAHFTASFHGFRFKFTSDSGASFPVPVLQSGAFSLR